MKVYRNLEEFRKLPFACVTSGTFDGVHVGHQTIIERLRSIANQHSGETVLITFWPHPRLVLYPDEHNLKLLSSLEEKESVLRQHGIDHFLIIPFTREFASLTSDEFIKKILVETIGTKKLVIGYDHKFGRNRSGSFEELKKNGPSLGFEVEEIPKQEVDHIGVSSTKIRNALAEGNIDIATQYLARPYNLSGTIIDGDKLGRTIGFPTANIQIDFELKLVPSDGTYAVKVRVDDELFEGMLNIGFRPTVHGRFKTVEVHILDFDREIYGKSIELFFIGKIRDERKFDSLEGLKVQLEKDEYTAREILSHSRHFKLRW